MLEACYKGGINFIDCAEVYGGGGSSERVLGDAIKIGMDKGTWERADLVISTKLHGGGRGAKDTINSIGLSRKHLYEGCKASLERMQLEYVDLIFCHRPDPRTPIEETVRGMNNLIDRGMAFYWGTSEWSAQMIQEARDVANRLGLVPPFFDQTQYNMASLPVRERIEVEYAPLYPELGLTIWSPLGGGVLTGKYGADPERWNAEWRSAGRLGQQEGDALTAAQEALLEKARIAEEVRPVAETLGCSVAQLALAWTLVNPVSENNTPPHGRNGWEGPRCGLCARALGCVCARERVSECVI